MNEKVNHPSHYQREGKKECIEEIKEKYGDYITCIFCLTNAYKYLYRAGAKEGNSAEQDIAKAKWYVNYIRVSGCGVPIIAGELWEDVERGLWSRENCKTEL